MSDLTEILDLVDEEDRNIGKASRGECFEKGLLHRASNILIFNSKGEVYLQRRSGQKNMFPHYWDLSSGEHVKLGEDFDEAAKRGLKEELGIKMELEVVIPVHHVKGDYGQYHDNELVITYKGVFDGEIPFNKDEIEEIKLFDILQLNKQIKEGSIDITPWLLEDLRLLGKLE